MDAEAIYNNPNKSRSYIGQTFVVNEYSKQEAYLARCCYQMTRNAAFAMARRAGDKVDTENWTTPTAKLILTGPEVKDGGPMRDAFYKDEIYIWVERDYEEE